MLFYWANNHFGNKSGLNDLQDKMEIGVVVIIR